MHCWPFQQRCLLQMTADKSLYVKLLNNVNIYQIDEFFSCNIKNTIRSIRKSRILLQEV